jgi:hypothetical protein
MAAGIRMWAIRCRSFRRGLLGGLMVSLRVVISGGSWRTSLVCFCGLLCGSFLSGRRGSGVRVIYPPRLFWLWERPLCC